MVAHSTRTIGIVVASIIALALIGVAFLISGPLPFHLSTANAESTHDLLVQYASKDSDNDGLPDWEEALYGTDPQNPHSVSQTATDGQAVAQGLVAPKFANATSTPPNANAIPAPTVADTTVTDQFAKALFGQYLQNRGTTPPTPDQIATLVEQGVAQLEKNQTPVEAFNAGQVHVSGTGADALKSYAASAEKAFTDNQVVEDKSEIEYLGDGVNKGDAASLRKVAEIGKSYTNTAKEYLAIPAPKELSSAHLEVANALARIGQTIRDLSVYNTDPLRTMVALGRYPQDVTRLAQALSDMNTAYTAEGISLDAGMPGSHFYSSLVLAAQTISQKP